MNTYAHSQFSNNKPCGIVFYHDGHDRMMAIYVNGQMVAHEKVN